MTRRISLALAVSVALSMMLAGQPARADHSWNGYHWARTANPFTLKLGDNLTSTWDPYLATASADWSASSVLDTTIVAGSAGNPKRCATPSGLVQVCNSKYGFNGWLGIAGISVAGGHIVAGYVKLNDSYFNTSTYNKPEWRRLVTCQEVAHAFGLDHQDEAFDNPNLGSCMDYSNTPLGPPSNEHPNAHDYEMIESIYAHTDTSTTVAQGTASSQHTHDHGHSHIERVDEHGNGTVTWIFWKP